MRPLRYLLSVLGVMVTAEESGVEIKLKDSRGSMTKGSLSPYFGSELVKSASISVRAPDSVSELSRSVTIAVTYSIACNEGWNDGAVDFVLRISFKDTTRHTANPLASSTVEIPKTKVCPLIEGSAVVELVIKDDLVPRHEHLVLGYISPASNPTFDARIGESAVQSGIIAAVFRPEINEGIEAANPATYETSLSSTVADIELFGGKGEGGAQVHPEKQSGDYDVSQSAIDDTVPGSSSLPDLEEKKISPSSSLDSSGSSSNDGIIHSKTTDSLGAIPYRGDLPPLSDVAAVYGDDQQAPTGLHIAIAGLAALAVAASMLAVMRGRRVAAVEALLNVSVKGKQLAEAAGETSLPRRATELKTPIRNNWTNGLARKDEMTRSSCRLRTPCRSPESLASPHFAITSPYSQLAAAEESLYEKAPLYSLAGWHNIFLRALRYFRLLTETRQFAHDRVPLTRALALHIGGKNASQEAIEFGFQIAEEPDYKYEVPVPRAAKVRDSMDGDSSFVGFGHVADCKTPSDHNYDQLSKPTLATYDDIAQAPPTVWRKPIGKVSETARRDPERPMYSYACAVPTYAEPALSSEPDYATGTTLEDKLKYDRDMTDGSTSGQTPSVNETGSILRPTDVNAQVSVSKSIPLQLERKATTEQLVKFYESAARQGSRHVVNPLFKGSQVSLTGLKTE